MSARIPDDAFEVYVGMGSARSYQALADKFGVDKRSIVRLATREKWSERLAQINQEVRSATDKRLATEIHAVRERHLQQSRFVQGILLKGMKEATPREAARMTTALSQAWKHELLVLGEPTEHHAATVEEITIREMRTLLKRRDDPEDEEPPAVDDVFPSDDEESDEPAGY